MSQLQSIAIFLSLVALAFAPGFIYTARQRDKKSQAPTGAPALRIREGLARRMYGAAVGWRPEAMRDYDESLPLQAMWQAEARYKLDGR
jgi:hypothetical protein